MMMMMNLEEVMLSSSRSRKLSFCTRYYVFAHVNRFHLVILNSRR